MTGDVAREDVLVWRGGAPLARTALLREAAAVAAQLPDHRYLVNLCEQRDAFVLAFAAAGVMRDMNRLREVDSGLIVQTARVSAPNVEEATRRLKDMASMLQMSDAEKNQISHRARALHALLAALRNS